MLEGLKVRIHTGAPVAEVLANGVRLANGTLIGSTTRAFARLRREVAPGALYLLVGEVSPQATA